jgi:PBP1b-binding outer membrane lipoprotein LpoB
MSKATAIIISLALSAIFLTGCGQRTLLDDNWGRSVKTAAFNQTLDPDAGLTAAPVEGMDGQSAANTLQRYRDSFRADEAGVDYEIKLTGIGLQN